MLLFIGAVAMTVYALGRFIADMGRFIGHAIVLASPRTDNKHRQVDGISLVPVYIMMVTVPYIAWFLIK